MTTTEDYPSRIEYMRQHFTRSNMAANGFYMTESRAGRSFVLHIQQRSSSRREAIALNNDVKARVRHILAGVPRH